MSKKIELEKKKLELEQEPLPKPPLLQYLSFSKGKKTSAVVAERLQQQQLLVGSSTASKDLVGGQTLWS